MKAEPAAIGAVIAALLNAVALLVLKEELTLEVQTAIVVAVTTLAGLFIRAKVTPVG